MRLSCNEMTIFKFKKTSCLSFYILCYVNGIVGNCQNYPGFCLSDCSTAIRGASWEDLRCWCAHKGHIGVSLSWRCPWGYRLFLCKTHQKSEAASCLKGLFDGSILYPTIWTHTPFLAKYSHDSNVLVIFTVLLHYELPDVICNSKFRYVQIFLHFFYLWIRLLG